MIGGRIKQARRLRELNQRDLAGRAGISAVAVSNYETGKNAPSSGVLLRIADALRVDVDYFFRTVSVNLGRAVHRDGRLPASDQATMEGRLIDKVERYLETLSLFKTDPASEFEPPHGFPREICCDEDIESSAEELRRQWEIGLDPIENLTELLEERGVLVVYEDDIPDFEACTYPDGNVRVIAANGKRPGDRTRFTLAHDIAHLLLKFPSEWRSDRKEKVAHRFAGAFLVPRAVARRELGNKRSTLAIDELHALKHKYGLSMQAWLHRAQELSVISDSAYKSLREMFVKQNWRETEPGLQYPAERSTRQERLVMRAFLDDIITEGRACELLAETREKFSERLSRVVDARVSPCTVAQLEGSLEASND